MEKAGGMFAAARDSVTGAFQGTTDKAVDTTKVAGGGATGTKNNVGDYVNTAVETVSKSAVTARDSAQAGIQATSEKVVEVAGGAADSVKNAFGMGGNPVTK